MTAIDKFHCRACGFEAGPFGTHGMSRSGDGESIGVCRACRKLAVVRVVAHRFQRGCDCGADFETHDQTCPACGSDDARWIPLGIDIPE